ncbi:MAG: DUF4340 domain-containing protein [Xenococcaceae cyanobacterium MO_167.B27]|nr:DUF4340 domain-containing protein [Xenococcaceae cyanobacterium MO_167.B27]
MKLKKTTWLLLLIAASLGGWVYFYEIKLEAEQVAIQKQEQKLFNFDIQDIQRITIQQGNEFLELVKSQDDTSSWLMKQPSASPVNDGVISFLLNLIEQGTSDRRILIAQDQLSQYGLDQPLAVITIELNNQQTYQILLGKETINPNLVYAQIASTARDSSTTEVILVSKNWHYAVIRDLKEWQDLSQ